MRRRHKRSVSGRTEFLRSGQTQLAVPPGPAVTYNTTFPTFHLSKERLSTCFHNIHDLVESFTALDAGQPEGGIADYKGFTFELKT